MNEKKSNKKRKHCNDKNQKQIENNKSEIRYRKHRCNNTDYGQKWEAQK